MQETSFGLKKPGIQQRIKNLILNITLVQQALDWLGCSETRGNQDWTAVRPEIKPGAIPTDKTRGNTMR